MKELVGSQGSALQSRVSANGPLKTIGLVAVALLATLPFLWKPLHIDDAADIQYVQQILRAPLDPYEFEFDWGEGPRPAIHNYHPPLKFYYHAAVLWLGGGGKDVYQYPRIELILHLSYLPFVFLTVFALAWLAGYFGAPALATVLFWCLGPGYLPGQNAMLDVPALALGLSGTVFFVKHVDRRDQRDGWIAGLVLLLALLTKYATAVFALFWGVWLMIRRSPLRTWVLVFGPAAAGIALWSVLSYVRYGWVHPLVVLSGVPGQVGAQAPRLVSLVDSIVYLGGALPGLLLYGLFVSARGAVTVLASFALAFALYVVRDPQLYVVEGKTVLTHESLVWWFWLAATGVFCVLEGGKALLGFWRSDKEKTLLGAWLMLGLLVGAASAPFVAMRRVLDAAAASTLLVFAGYRARDGRGSMFQRLALPLAVGINVLVGYAVAVSDYVFAGVYPEFASRIASQQPRFGHHRAWCYGYWGWMYYAQRNGLKRYIPGREEPAVGDMFVWPDTVAKPAVIPEALMARLERIFQEYRDSYVPARLMSKQAGAGYYSNAWGPLPYTWSRMPLEVLNAALVKEPATDERRAN